MNLHRIGCLWCDRPSWPITCIHRWSSPTYTRPHGVRHLLAAYDVTADKLYGHMKKRKSRTQFLEFCRYLRSLYPPEIRIAIVLDNYSPHRTTNKDTSVGTGPRQTT